MFGKDGAVICLFNISDELAYLPSRTQKDSTIPLLHACNFSPFDMDKEMNLAYVRKYQENGEKNTRILNINDRYVVAIKRNAKKELSEKSFYTIFLFNVALEQIYSEKIPYRINPTAIFNYRDGFILFNDSLNKAYYYDLEK